MELGFGMMFAVFQVEVVVKYNASIFVDPRTRLPL